MAKKKLDVFFAVRLQSTLLRLDRRKKIWTGGGRGQKDTRDTRVPIARYIIPKHNTQKGHGYLEFLIAQFFAARLNFSKPSRRIRVDLLSYESKTTDKRGQYDGRAEKNLDGCFKIPMECCHTVLYTRILLAKDTDFC